MTQDISIKSLRNSTEMDHLFASSGIGFVLVAPDQKILDASQTFCTKIGYSLEQLKKMHVFDYTHPDDMVMTSNLFNVRSGKNLVDIFEKKYITRQGEELWCKLRSQAIEDDNGKVIARLALVEDVTNDKLNEMQLEHMAAIIDASDDAIFRADTNSIIQFWGKGAEKLYGYSSAEAIGQPVRIIAASDDDKLFNEAMEKLLRGEVVRDPDTLARHKNGKLIEISSLAFSIRNKEGIIIAYAATHRDISAFKQLEMQFRHAQRLETAGLLAGGIAHDFNNIITVIQGASNLLAQDLQSNRAAVATLNLIEKSSEKATKLTRQLLAFSSKQNVIPIIIDPNTLISENANLISNSLGEAILLELNLQSSWYIKEDATQLEQILLNLAVNARHAMPDGGNLRISTKDLLTDSIPLPVPDSLQHTPTQISPGEYVQITVTDTGCGIPDDVLDKIFDPFFTTKPKEQGTGLGLSVVYGMITQAGGGISVNTTPGDGSSFHLYLPRALGTINSEIEPTSTAVTPGKVLVLEDDAGVRMLAVTLLEEAGYRVSQAASPKEILDGLVDTDVDLILSDVMMPHMSGPEFADHWIKSHPDSRFLFMSGYFNDENITGTLEGRTLIQKPFKPSALLDAVNKAIQSR